MNCTIHFIAVNLTGLELTRCGIERATQWLKGGIVALRLQMSNASFHDFQHKPHIVINHPELTTDSRLLSPSDSQIDSRHSTHIPKTPGTEMTHPTSSHL